LHRKGLVIGILILMLGVNIGSTFAGDVDVKTVSSVGFDGNTLYVGGLGPNNYTTIQSAIDDAVDGDTVFVYDDSSPYNENVKVDKSITLKGENKETTVINGSGGEFVVSLSSDKVILSGFTVQYYGNNSNLTYSLISIQSHYNVISGNIIIGDAMRGIDIDNYENNSISHNIISCSHGIVISYGKNNNISGNVIKDCVIGINLAWISDNNSIYGNTLTNNSVSIAVSGFFCINGVISLNNISYNYIGIFVINCLNYKITKNNFISNFINVRFAYILRAILSYGFQLKSLRDIQSTITWDGNYWNKPRNFPKPIFGRLGPYSLIPWINFDWNPAQEPYDIEV